MGPEIFGTGRTGGRLGPEIFGTGSERVNNSVPVSFQSLWAVTN